MKTAIISMIMLISSLMLYAQQGQGFRYDSTENILNDAGITLTAKQKITINTLISKHHEECEPINEKISAIRKQIGNELKLGENKEIDRNKIKSLILERSKLEAEREYLKIITDIEILGSLDESQLIKLREHHIRNRGNASDIGQKQGMGNRNRNRN